MSCVKNAREAWVSLKEQYGTNTVAEELQLVKKFNAMKLGSVLKNPVERFCIPLELVWSRLQELGMEIPKKHIIPQVLGNLTKEYNIQCQVMGIKLSAGKLTIQGMYNQLEMQFKDLTSTKTLHKNGHRKSAFSWSNIESSKESTSGAEDALVAQFKGRCCKCG